MTLTKYNKKRASRTSPEPIGKKHSSKNTKRIFVVQKHDAGRLHYDFRIEMDGALKSWAIAKGPSLNPSDRRLAIRVEDHPYDYKDFEGTIPEGNYGAGNVIVWDIGTFDGIEKGKFLNEKEMLKNLREGHLSLNLYGHKLKGEFSLIQMKGKRENEWLLIKKEDRYASANDILKKDKSVLTNRPLKPRKRGNRQIKNAKAEKRVKPDETDNLKGAKKTKPKRMAAMKATLTEEVFDDPEWIYEIKYDGYRALALIVNGKPDLYSRNLKSFNKSFPSLVNELSMFEENVLLDGEIVVVDEKGKSHFQLLQNYQKTGKGKLRYYAFDILYFKDKELTSIPLIRRKEILKNFISQNNFESIFYSDHIEESGKDFYKEAKKHQLEGIIGKNRNSIYRPGIRSKSWLKFKISKQQEAIIAGLTAPQGSRQYFGSLILGLYENGQLQYAGNCGTGFSDEELKRLHKKLKKYFIKKCPFLVKPLIRQEVQWIKPLVVCEVKFTEWTREGSMRHPVYLGIRQDKKPKEVIMEISAEAKPRRNRKKRSAPNSPKPSTLKQSPPDSKTITRKIGKVKLRITNQNKIYWPEEGITKGELIDYYDRIAPLILPYLKERPQSMHRFPNGISGKSFYQKDAATGKMADWVKTEKVFSKSNSKNIHYLVCNDRATLIYMANLGCIEINPWSSRISNPDKPDWMIIDLDPGEIGFQEVVKTALTVKELFDELKIECYCKTSGATGLHIYTPLKGKYEYDVVREFAGMIARTAHALLPETTSVIRNPAKRKKKIYIDYLQNSRGQTVAAPYSVRPMPGATVSTPLEWKEVNEELDPSDFTIQTIFKRLEKKGDLWKAVNGKNADLHSALKKLESWKEPR